MRWRTDQAKADAGVIRGCSGFKSGSFVSAAGSSKGPIAGRRLRDERGIGTDLVVVGGISSDPTSCTAPASAPPTLPVVDGRMKPALARTDTRPGMAKVRKLSAMESCASRNSLPSMGPTIASARPMPDVQPCRAARQVVELA